MSQTRDFVKKVPRSELDDWTCQGGLLKVAILVSLRRESQSGNGSLEWVSSVSEFDLSSHLGEQWWHTSQRADCVNLCWYLSALCLPLIPLLVLPQPLPAKIITNTVKHYKNIPELFEKCFTDRHECEDEPCLRFCLCSSLALFKIYCSLN